MEQHRIDLHTHSQASDGSFTPIELADHAHELGLVAVALTDHDTVSGLPDFIKRTEELDDIIGIPGVEVSVLMNNRELHIVGLFIDDKNIALNELLARTRSERDKRNDNIIRRLNGLGYEITLDEVKTFAKGESIGRPHLAQLLIKKGYFTDVQDVFDKCLKRGTPGYCPRVLPLPSEAIQAIHDAGGIAIWAHPVYRTGGERSYIRRTLKSLTKFGLDGLEGYYPMFTEYQHEVICDLAQEFDMLISGGSDFHGKNQPSISLGTGIDDNLTVPYSVYQNMQSFLSI